MQYMHSAQLSIISIHALREEGDKGLTAQRRKNRNFYPRPPRGGRQRQPNHKGKRKNFYPRPPRGGRPMAAFLPGIYEISIHALREEGDCWRTLYPAAMGYFYPRPPRGGRHIRGRLLHLSK